MKDAPKPIEAYLVIGAGGGGCWTASALAKGGDNAEKVWIMDGDLVEHKNLDRQGFREADVGHHKASVLAEKLGCQAIPSYLMSANSPLPAPISRVRIFGEVDNHPTRSLILNLVDRNPQSWDCIISANEKVDSEAYYYRADWKDTFRDPRTYYPELLSVTTGHPADPCHVQASQGNTQTVIANFVGSALSLWLHRLWVARLRRPDQAPYHIKAGLNLFTASTKENTQPKENKDA